MSILVDTSVWIDLFAGRDTPQTTLGRRLIASKERLLVGDLVLVEVLQGTRSQRDLARKLALMSSYDQMSIASPRIATQAARNFQHLRSLGITVRKTIDTLIATRCILDNIPLLFADRDFLPFVEHLDLRSALDTTGMN